MQRDNEGGEAFANEQEKDHKVAWDSFAEDMRHVFLREKLDSLHGESIEWVFHKTLHAVRMKAFFRGTLVFWYFAWVELLEGDCEFDLFLRDMQRYTPAIPWVAGDPLVYRMGNLLRGWDRTCAVFSAALQEFRMGMKQREF